jgi:hypothetical protein
MGVWIFVSKLLQHKGSDPATSTTFATVPIFQSQTRRLGVDTWNYSKRVVTSIYRQKGCDLPPFAIPLIS